MAFFENLQTQFGTLWGQLESRQRWTLGAAFLMVMGAFFALILWANQTDYAPLYGKLGQDAAPEIVAKLKEQKIPYRLSQGGQVIEVPREQVLEIRLSLASEGIPKQGSIGFEIFDNPSVSMTDFVQKLNYQRALQGELQRTINDMDMVESSRVLLALPQKSLFVEDQRPATASVVLKLVSEATPQKRRVRAIANLVASSIEGMTPDQVSIVDNHGKILLEPTDAGDFAGGQASTLLDYQENLERKQEARITRFLERLTGPGRVMVKVQADLDMTSEEVLKERFDPDSQVARSTQTTTENREATIPGPEGAPGTDANLPGQAAARAQENIIEKLDESQNYEIDKTTSKIVEMPGRLSRLSVAVLVDHKEMFAEDGTRTYEPWNAEERVWLNQVVKGAIGYDEARGDTLELHNIPFHSLEASLEKTSSTLAWQAPARYGLLVLGMVLVFFLLRPILQTLTADPKIADAAIAGALPEGIPPGMDPALAEELYGAGALDAGEMGLDSQRLLTAGTAEKQRREEMINIARSDMDNTIATLREWLTNADEKMSA